MEQEKVKYLIDMINNMDIKDKLRLAICMSQSKWSGLIYNTKVYYERFERFYEEKYSVFMDLVLCSSLPYSDVYRPFPECNCCCP